MPTQICKQCSQAFDRPKHSTVGRPALYCAFCATPTEAAKRSKAKARGELPEAWQCAICAEHSDDKTLYPFCSEKCQAKTIPALCRVVNLSEKKIRKLIDRGLFIALQNPTFDLTDLQEML